MGAGRCSFLFKRRGRNFGRDNRENENQNKGLDREVKSFHEDRECGHSNDGFPKETLELRGFEFSHPSEIEGDDQKRKNVHSEMIQNLEHKRIRHVVNK